MRRLRGWIKSICSQLLRWHAILVWKLVVLSGCVPQQRSFMTILLLTLHMHPHWHKVPSVERERAEEKMRKAFFQFLQINRVFMVRLCICGRVHICARECLCACTSQSARGFWVGWVNDDDCGFRRNFEPCLATDSCKCACVDASARTRDRQNAATERERQTERDGDRRGQGDVPWFTVPPPKKPQPQSMLQALVTAVWGWQRMEVAAGSRFNQTDLVPSCNHSLTAYSSHVKKCRQVV